MKNRNIAMGLIILKLTAAPVLAQSVVKIEGRVMTEAGIPLVGANVTVSGTTWGAATDTRGHFSIENLFVGEYDLTASYIGYDSETQKGVRVRAEVTTTVTFRLRPRLLAFPPVMVATTRPASQAGGQMTLISSQEIRQSNARTIGDLLAKVAGVEVITAATGANQPRISVRGSATNQVLVVLDGVSLNDPLTGEANLGAVAVSNIDKIQVWKGGSSSRFGSGALGGVIEIFSRKNPVDEIRVSGQAGSFGSYGIQPTMAGSFKKFNYHLNFEHHQSAGDFPYQYQQLDGIELTAQRMNADFNTENYSGTFNVEPGNHAFQLQLQHSATRHGLPGLVFSWTPFATAHNHRGLLNFQYRLQLHQWQNRIVFSKYSNATEFKHLPPASAPFIYRTVPGYHSKYQVETQRIEYESTLLIGSNSEWHVLTQWQQDQFKDQDLLRPHTTRIDATTNQTYSLGSWGKWALPPGHFFDRSQLSAALRFDRIQLQNKKYQRTDQHFSPQFDLLIGWGPRYYLNSNLNLGESFRAPTFADLFYQDFRVSGKPDLLPEKSRNLNLALIWGGPLLGQVEIETAYFRNEITNLITWELGSFANYQPTNTDARLSGWEFSGNWRGWKNRLELSGNHLLLAAVNLNPARTTYQKRLTYRPEYTTKFIFKVDGPWFLVEYQRRWVGERFITAANTVKMPAYILDDLTLQINGGWRKMRGSLKFSILNLWNVEYYLVERAPLPGRNWRIGLDWSR
ncbi:TonB-dependent receptor, partial [candidate division KSB1 bacterium]|nr:TonB-dependent receptor [candidate division KSB1 bacterium]